MITTAMIALAAAKAAEERERANSRAGQPPESEKKADLDTLLLLLASCAIIPGGL